MIETRIVRDIADTMDLLETYSTDGYKLLQADTGIIYGKSVIDPLGHAHTYTETDEKDEEVIPDELQPADGD